MQKDYKMIENWLPIMKSVGICMITISTVFFIGCQFCLSHYYISGRIFIYQLSVVHRDMVPLPPGVSGLPGSYSTLGCGGPAEPSESRSSLFRVATCSRCHVYQQVRVSKHHSQCSFIFIHFLTSELLP